MRMQVDGNAIQITKEELGRGSFAVVYKGTFKEKEVAIKKVPLTWIEPNSDPEVETLEKLDHPNIVKMWANHADKYYKYIVLELCAASLDHYCLPDDNPRKYKGAMPKDRDVLLQMATGLQYIHSKNLVHRDIRPSNILISMSEPIQMKISDFGLCKSVSPTGSYSITSLKGNTLWMPPEILNLTDRFFENALSDLIPSNDIIKGSARGDIFSSGCVFFFYLTKGDHPFGSPYMIASNILENDPVHMKKLPADHFASSLITRMIAHYPKNRITFAEVIDILQKDKNDA